jgi:hypothetical protein
LAFDQPADVHLKPSAPQLTIQDYNQRELQATDVLPNRVVEMVNPVVYASEGYPLRVRQERTLSRYLDVNHETRFERDFAGLHEGGFTAQEFDWVKRVATLACDYSMQAFGQRLTARSSLSRSLHVFRTINDLVGHQPLRVFEVGPGSGNLGGLFIQNDWGYAATDIAQAFYLLQNRLWNHATNGGVIEMAAADTEWDGQVLPEHPVHLPWWEFFSLIDRTMPSVDVVTCNHALAEMHPNSLAFTLLVAQRLLRGEGLKFFAFEGWGFEKLHSRDMVIQQFLKNDFCLLHMDEKITVFAPKHTLARADSPLLPGGPIKGYVKSDACTYLPNNTLTPLIFEGRIRRKANLSIGLEEVTAFYRRLLDSEDIRTPEERFLSLIGKSY